MPRDKPPFPWPANARASITITMDNMGEAADLNRNLWPADVPIGSHYSVTQCVPQMLDLLDKYNVKGTYFIESWNVDHYPDAIYEVAKRGHEVAWHAYQHEAWSKLTAEEEASNFKESFTNIAKLSKKEGITTCKGFRPPGGVIHGQRTLKLMKKYGLDYLSPAAEEPALVEVDGDDEGIVILPFRWRNIDAHYYMDTFAGLRELKDERREPTFTADELAQRYIQSIDDVLEKRGYITFLFHPFLTDSPERLGAMEKVLHHLKTKEDQIWSAPCGEVAKWVRENRESFPKDPEWDNSSWR